MRVKTLSLLIAGLFASHTYAQQTPTNEEKKTTDIGTINITGEGDKLGTGNIIQEESPKARSTVTRAAMDKQRSTSNPYQSLSLLPGVNTYNHDATGFFGGGLRVRGFNSDQMGFTVDDAPVNDSGSFSVFPQEYTDQENTCEIFITQGSTDTGAPHVGATGGNVGIVTCDPIDEFRVRAAHTTGGLNLKKSFIRFDSGKLGIAKGWRTFLSYSEGSVDKFRGPGEADRKHIDFKTVLNLGKGSQLSATVLYNDALNNNYRIVTAAQAAEFGRYFDFSDVFIPDPKPATGSAQVATPIGIAGAYYKLALNPFRNAIITAKGNFALNQTMRLDIEPYFWYGYGTGGTQQAIFREGGTFKGGLRDINFDSDVLDTVTVYRSNVTKTHRPGATVKFNWQLDNHKLTFGYWFERARHKQTQPATYVNGDGTSADLWLQNSDLWLKRADGSAYQGRNQLTITEASSLFVQDSINLMNDRLNLQLGLKIPKAKRGFSNYANEGTNQAADYQIKRTFDQVLPSVGAKYQLSDENQIFVNIARNSKVPGNFSYGGLYINNVLREDLADRVQEETATNIDAGYRYFGKRFTLSGSVFNIQFKNRIARSYDLETARSIENNVGDARMHGFELEAGTTPINGFSAYSSLSYTKTKIKNDLLELVGTTPILKPTSGKEFPDTPNWLASLGLQYANGPFYAGLSAKYTGKSYSTLTNDEMQKGYTITDLNIGYKLGKDGWFWKSATVRLNVSNLWDTHYLSLSSGSGSQFTTNATGPGATFPTYYIGAPRLISLSFTADF